MAKNPKPQPGQAAGDQQQLPNADEGEGVESRRSGPVNLSSMKFALEAAAVKAVKPVKAFVDVVKPLVERMEAIDKITDPKAKIAALEQFQKDAPSIIAAMKKNPSLANATIAEAVRDFEAGLKGKKS